MERSPELLTRLELADKYGAVVKIAATVYSGEIQVPECLKKYDLA